MGRTRCAVVVGALAFVLALVGAATGGADTFAGWKGKTGPFAWEARLLACGAVGEQPSRVRAHTRWSRSPANGFTRLTFQRQLRDDVSGAWETVQRQRRSTRNTRLEGADGILHWSQLFMPFENDAGRKSRHLVLFEWLRDRPGADRVVLRRSFVSRTCVVGG
jgi:hypothetical protein